jgi:hypothetical protein
MSTPAPALPVGLGRAGIAGLISVGLVLALSSASVWAQNRIYTCKDDKGKTITSDRPLQECMDREQRILGKDGTLIQKIDAPLTADQKAARAAEDQKKRQEDDRRREQMRKDKALVNTYENVDDLESKRQRSLQQVEREARESEKRMAILQKQANDNNAEAEFYKKKPMPADLKRRIDENEAALRAEKLLLASKRDEVTQVNQKFDDEKKRYIELTGAPPPASKAAPPAPTPASAKK